MEFLLLYWDELDDLAALCRHLSRSFLEEVGASLRIARRPRGRLRLTPAPTELA